MAERGRGHTQIPLQGSTSHKTPGTCAGPRAQTQGGSDRNGREGVPMMARLGFPNNLAGWDQICLKNNPM